MFCKLGTYRHDSHLHFVSKIHGCQEELEAWGRRVRNIFRDDIRKTKQKMESLRGKEDDELIKEYNREKKNLTKFLLQEERFRKQCSKVHWLGDQPLMAIDGIYDWGKRKNR